MLIESVKVLVVMTVLITVLWMVIGLGAAKMVSKINEKPIELLDIVLWPIVAVVFAACKGV